MRVIINHEIARAQPEQYFCQTAAHSPETPADPARRFSASIKSSQDFRSRNHPRQTLDANFVIVRNL